MDLIKDTAKYSKDSIDHMSKRLKDEPAGEIIKEKIETITTTSAEYGSKAYNSTKQKVTNFYNSGELDKMSNKAKSFGSSFWGYIWSVTNEDKAKLERENDANNDSGKNKKEKPLFGFT